MKTHMMVLGVSHFNIDDDGVCRKYIILKLENM